MQNYTKPHFPTSALIVIDMQNDFVLKNSPVHIEGTAEVLQSIAHLLQAYRQRKLPIFHVIRLYQRDGSNADLCRRAQIEKSGAIVEPNTHGAEIVDVLKLAPEIRLNTSTLLSGHTQVINTHEFILYKPRWGAFYGTSLDSYLRELKIDTLVFAGCNFPNCPRTSIYEASERDFRIVVAQDAVSQLYPKAEQELASIGANILKNDRIIRLLNIPPPASS